MSSLVGQTQLRERLKSHSGSFALVGPQGVGRRLVVSEWAQDRPVKPLEDVKQALVRPDVVWVSDASKATSVLQPLEECRFTLVLLSDRTVPDSIASRVPVFHAGLLSEVEIIQILASSFPSYGPRPIVARLAQGSLTNLEFHSEVAKTIETLDKALSSGTVPDLRKFRPLAVFSMLTWLARDTLGLESFTFSDLSRSFFDKRGALEVLRLSLPRTDVEARNLLHLLLGGRNG